MMLAGKVGMAQRGAAVEYTQADSATGQAARVGMIGADGRQAPVTQEFLAAPAFRLDGLCVRARLARECK